MRRKHRTGSVQNKKIYILLSTQEIDTNPKKKKKKKKNVRDALNRCKFCGEKM